jgi:Ser/Thr protein kinase RdoA (MazF antagonist)
MTPVVFVKSYSDPARCATARAHLEWLAQLGSGVLLPRLCVATATSLVLERLDGRHAGLSDLVAVGAALGRLHGVAYERELHAASLNQPFRTATGLTIAGFSTGRLPALAAAGVSSAGLSAALYKDTNIRNVVVTTTGPAMVDFDDLTLAPFGYDLAKLVVSAAMTYGAMPVARIEAARAAYNRHVGLAGGPSAPCSLAQLMGYTEIHHLLTARYLRRNGYRHAWPTVRPWRPPRPNAEGASRGHHNRTRPRPPR